MGKACCGTNHSPQCDCLPSSLSIAIPAWSNGGYSYAGGTVIAYTCCWRYVDLNDYAPYNHTLYRFTPIIVGTTTHNSCTTNVYFNYTIYINQAGPTPSGAPCVAIHAVTLIYSKDDINTSGCNLCVTPRTITALTACDGVSSDLLCSQVTFGVGSFWGTARNCNNCEPIAAGWSNISNATNTFNLTLNNPCEIPSSTTATFPYLSASPFTFTIT